MTLQPIDQAEREQLPTRAQLRGEITVAMAELLTLAERARMGLGTSRAVPALDDAYYSLASAWTRLGGNDDG